VAEGCPGFIHFSPHLLVQFLLLNITVTEYLIRSDSRLGWFLFLKCMLSQGASHLNTDLALDLLTRLFPGATTQQSTVEKTLTSDRPVLQLADVLEAAADSLIHFVSARGVSAISAAQFA
jgi:hypothetical protein